MGTQLAGSGEPLVIQSTFAPVSFFHLLSPAKSLLEEDILLDCLSNCTLKVPNAFSQHEGTFCLSRARVLDCRASLCNHVFWTIECNLLVTFVDVFVTLNTPGGPCACVCVCVCITLIYNVSDSCRSTILQSCVAPAGEQQDSLRDEWVEAILGAGQGFLFRHQLAWKQQQVRENITRMIQRGGRHLRHAVYNGRSQAAVIHIRVMGEKLICDSA